ncbi:MAG: HEAT repeat domain-containing protein [Nitrospirae bacterium]|nr:HEAT repeat domain-containing protein [Nitrospirota bacterium]
MSFPIKRVAMMSGYEQDIKSFPEQIGDSDSSVRCDAIRQIIGIKDGRLLYPLIKSLQDDDLGVQQAAMDALLVYDDEAAVYNLIPLLADKRVAVKNLAQEILEKTGGSGLNILRLHIHDRDEDVRKMIADILGRLELGEAVPILIEMMRDSNDNVRSSAIEGLGRITDQSIVDYLIDLLKQEDWVTLFAVESLGRLGDIKAVNPLVSLIKSTKNADVQYMAIDALSHISGDVSVAGLLEVIACVKPEIMDMAVMGIVTLMHGEIGPVIDKFGRDEFTGHLVRLAANLDKSEQDNIIYIMKAFQAIGSSRCAEEVLKLTDALDRDNTDLLNKAVEVIKDIGEETTLINSLNHGNDINKLVSVRGLGLLRSEKAITSLTLLFDEVDRDLKMEILSAMGNIGGQEAFRFISGKLSCDEGHIREAAVEALGEMAEADAIKPLLERLMKEEYHNVIARIVSALIRIGLRYKKEELAYGLINGLYSKNPSIREMVVKGLGELRWIDSSEEINRLLNDENWRVRRACLEVLGIQKDEGLLDNLIIAAHDEKDEVRMVVAQLLSEYKDDRAIDTLIELLENNNDLIQIMAIEGLVRQKSIRAIPHFMRLAVSQDYTVRKSSIWALGELGAQEAEDILRAAASDEDQEIRDFAVEAYNKLMSSKYVNY